MLLNNVKKEKLFFEVQLHDPHTADQQLVQRSTTIFTFMAYTWALNTLARAAYPQLWVAQYQQYVS